MTDASVMRLIESLPPQKRKLLAELLAPQREPIAVVGMACRLPGADTPEQLWKFLSSGGDAVIATPEDRWDAAAFYDADPSAPGKVPSIYGAFLPQVDQFDPEFFNIAPREAPRIDPQQRLLLEIAWETLEDAGVRPARLAGSSTGVFVGMYESDYSFNAFSQLDKIDHHSAAGVSHAIAANRISFTYDLRGPSLAIDTACSSSMVAVHLACNSLLSGESELALALGVNVMLSPVMNISFAKWGAFAPDGRCKTFDQRADGLVRGEGCVGLLLKRASAAVRDGDTIRALIRGSAVNQDGRTAVLTAPSGLAQQAVITQALRNAGVDPVRVEYVETHGTGTPIGDPIEFAAIKAALGKAPKPRVLGALKTNIGHVEAASGIAGMVKAILCLEHGAIPPNLHFERPNPHLAFDPSEFTVPTALQAWPASDQPRIASVSSFGFGGTNANVILQEAPLSAPDAAVPGARSELFLLSGGTAAALRDQARALASWARSQSGTANLQRAAHTLALRRTHFNHRLAVVASDFDSLAQRLEALDADGPDAQTLLGSVQTGSGSQSAELGFVFGGQGSQWAGMALPFASEEPAFRRELERCDRALSERLGWSVIELLESNNAQKLALTEYAQPAVFAVQVALSELWRTHWGVRTAAVVGHSLGEVAAAYCAGALSFEQAATVCAVRARCMAQVTGHGRMLSVALGPDALAAELSGELRGVELGAVNAPDACVATGDAEAVARLAKQLEGRGVRVRDLGVDYAFHSAQMDSILGRLGEQLASIQSTPPASILMSTVSGRPYEPGDFAGAYWCRNVRRPVRFAQAIASLLERGVRTFVEISPERTLAAAVRRCAEAAGVSALVVDAMRREPSGRAASLLALGRLHVEHVPVELSGAFAGRTQMARLPHYAFQRRRFWTAGQWSPQPKAASSMHPLLGEPVTAQDGEQRAFEVELGREKHAFLLDHQMHEVSLVPCSAWVELAWAVARELTQQADGGVCVEALAIHEPLILAEGSQRVRSSVRGREGESLLQLEISRVSDAGGAGSRYAEARLQPTVQPAPQSAPISLSALSESLKTVLYGDEYYQLGAALGGGLGPRFQGLQRIWRSDGEALAHVVLPEVARPESQAYRAYPGLLDCALHMVYAALPLGSSAALFLPTGVDRATLHRALPQELYCHFRLRQGDNETALAGDIDLYDAAGALVATLEGARFRSATRSALMHGELRQWLYVPRWEPLPVGSQTPLHARRRWFVIDDGSQLTGALARTLGDGAQLRALAPERSLSEQLAGEPSTRDEPLRVLFLGGFSLTTPEATLRASERLLELFQYAAHADPEHPVEIAIATRGAQAVVERDLVSGASGAALWGMARTYTLEYVGRHATLIDLEPGRELQFQAADLALALHSAHEPQLAVRDGSLWRLRLVRAPAPSKAASASLDVASGSYLVTGALGGIGRQLARWLVGRKAPALMLVGRRDVDADAAAFMAELRKSGATIEYAAVDLADAAQVERLFLEWKLPTLRGVFHAAGALDDATIPNQTPARLAATFSSKVVGTEHLAHATRELPLQLFVSFSSAAALLGSPGQANYAAANAFLDAFSEQQARAGRPYSSINWGAWSEVGMAARAPASGAQRRRATGMGEITPAQGIEALELALAAGLSQLAVLPMDWAQLRTLIPSGLEPPLLEYLLGKKPADPNYGRLRSEIEAAAPSERVPRMIEALGGRVRAVLALSSDRPFDTTRGFFDMGMDSLTLIELRDFLLSSLGIEASQISPTVIFDHPSVTSLSQYLVTELMQLSTEDVEKAPDALDALSKGELVDLLNQEISG